MNSPSSHHASGDAPLQPIAVLLCLPDDVVSSHPEQVPFTTQTPSFLLNVVDRPLLQHNIESLVHAGIRHIKILSHVVPEKIRHLLENGERWGCQIDYHLIQDAENPLQHFASLNIPPSTPIVLAYAHIVYALAHWQTLPMPCVIQSQSNEEDAWLYASAGSIGALPCHQSYQAWVEHILNAHYAQHITAEPALSCANGEALLKAQEAILTKQFPAQYTGYEIESGIWMSRNVVLHPTVKIHAPVYFGEDCMVDEGVEIGPNVAISNTCRIGNHSIINHSAIQAGTWVGEQLTCQHLIVQPARIWNTLSHVDVKITDAFLIAMLGTKTSFVKKMGQLLLSALGRLCALLLWTISLPLHLAYRFLAYRLMAPNAHTASNEVVMTQYHTDSESLSTRPAVRYPPPQAREQNGLKHLLGWLLPGLIHVASGRWHWVGLPPCSLEALNDMDEDWKIAYLSSKIGLIDETWIAYQAHAEFFERRLSELYYASHHGAMQHDLTLLSSYPAALMRKPTPNL